MQIGDLFFPIENAQGFDHLVIAGNITGYAEPGFNIAGSQNFFQYLVISKRRFDKQLRLVKTFGVPFQLFDPFGTLRFINR